MTKDTSGPAFPFYRYGNEKDLDQYSGFTKRERYALAAMQGLIGPGDERAPQSEFNLMAKASFAMADAMIAEGSK